ncbi:LysR family transcriptional regulator [Clostridium sp. AWRP]|uniref:LysR family transcriptional regulator n=1 Tax=Clostridium sp. AWRP TaxID=2212991 RepID=UPI000FD70F3F|nr:LysR family transcriptional regulator [Clostridium sp. AWRP]AZV56870.1 LysR family transcriptional regulator [Clostridium sp. AWRP]
MTIRHLKIFITVCEEGNMTSAANKLFMTQPSISQAIKELENYYEVILFERLSRKLYITSSGEKLYQYAKHIIKLFDEAGDDLRQNSLQKKLIIGANYTAGVVLIHKYIKKFNKLYPNSEIMVNVNKSSILTEMLRKNELDLALIEEIKSKSDFVEEVFYNDHIVVVAHPKHHLFSKKEVTAYDIVNERLLLREKGSGVRNLFELRMNEIGLFFKPYWESTSTTALINAAKNNIGIAVLPFQLIKDHIVSGALKELKVKDMDFNRKLTIVYHKNKLLTSAMKDFIKICHEL